MKEYFCELCNSVHFKKRSRFCSDECRTLYRKSKVSPMKGRKQSVETILKRIKNTDQAAKQEKFKATMKERYGVENPSQLLEVKEIISEAVKNRPKTKRSAEHSAKIADKRRKNGTNLHTQATKDRLKEGMIKHYSNPDLDRSVYISEVNKSWHKTGYVGNNYFRSSYEEKFLMFCQRYQISVLSAATKDFAVNYTGIDGKLHKYYPDFYLPLYDTVIEVKPIKLIDVYPNDVKIQEGLKTHKNFIILTELDDFFDESSWDRFYSNIKNNWI